MFLLTSGGRFFPPLFCPRKALLTGFLSEIPVIRGVFYLVPALLLVMKPIDRWGSLMI
jgi:hypothetical protein